MPVNAVVTADERVLVLVPKSKSMPYGSNSPRPKAESRLDFEAVQARAETITTVLEDILRAKSIEIGGNGESAG